jgi:DNA polymerase-1
MKILFVDGHNFMYRARSGFQLGDYNVVYNFFRSLKPLVDQFAPNRVYFTLEGHPKKRYELLAEYKANRHVVAKPDATPEEVVEYEKKRKSEEDYRRQQSVIVDVLSKMFPVSVMRHRDYEADDLIYNVINNASRAVEFVVVSTDTDFIQLLQKFPNVKLYNPVTKMFVEAPSYDYITWKALRGDGSDNIPGIPGIGDKLAEDVMGDDVKLTALMEEHGATFERNVELIQFPQWTLDEMSAMESSAPVKDWETLAGLFESWAFKSMLKEPYWSKFKATFDTLWG